MIRVGLLSFWHLHAADHARAAREHPETEIVAIWDEDPTRGAAEAARHGVQFDADLGRLLARADIDAVIVDAPTSAHLRVITAAARAGKHIFTEKVLAATLGEADRIIEETRRAHVSLTVSMERSDHAYTAVIRQLIDDGVLGRITQLRVRDGHHAALPTVDHPQGFLPARFWDPVTAQGGALIDLCHPVYLIAALLGMPQTVAAALGGVTGHALEDSAVVTMWYADEAIAIAETTTATPFGPFVIEAHGTAGSLVYTEEGKGEAALRMASDEPVTGDRSQGLLRLRTHETNGWEQRELPTRAAPTAFDKWVTSIQTGTRTQDNVELARALSAIVDASYMSARSGARAPVEVVSR